MFRYQKNMNLPIFLILTFVFVGCSTVPHHQGVIKILNEDPMKPTINVVVAGQEKTLTLDSGANIPFLRPLTKKSASKSVESNASSIDVFGQTVDKVTVEKVKFNIGPIEIDDVTTRFSEELHSEGLPLKLIESSQMIFDFAKSEITLGQEANFCEPKAQFRSSKGLNFVRIRIGEVKHWMLWDTGASTSILQESLVKIHGLSPSKEMSLTITSPHNKAVSTPTRLFETQITIAGQKEDFYFITRDLGKTMALVNKDAEGILGYNFIKKYKWFFDFNNKTYCMVKN